MTLLAIWTWMKKVPGWVWLVVIGALAGFAYLEGEKSKVRKEVNDKRDKESAEVEREVITNITENSDAVIEQADAVRSHTSASVLPDGTATLPDAHYRD